MGWCLPGKAACGLSEWCELYAACNAAVNAIIVSVPEHFKPTIQINGQLAHAISGGPSGMLSRKRFNMTTFGVPTKRNAVIEHDVITDSCYSPDLLKTSISLAIR